MRFAPFAAAVLATLAGLASSAQAAPTWITVGERPYLLLLKAAPELRAVATRRVPVTKPELRGSSTMVRGSESIYAVEVDDEVLDQLSADVHRELHRCGSYIRHESKAEALATLHRLATPPEPQRLPSYTIDNPTQVNPRLPLMQASNILSTITQMQSFQNRRFNSSHGANASNWLFSQWQALNPGNRRDVRVTQFTHSGFNQKSVEFTITGASNASEVIVLGAHLDSINGGSNTAETQRAPGADDDASGVASLTEIIRVMMASNYFPQRTIRFIAYAAEEVGLVGSRAIVAALPGRRDRTVGVLQLDMTAYQGDATDLWIYTDYTSPVQNQFIAALAAAYLPTLTVGYDFCGYGCSDHASWFNAGYPVSFPFESSDANFNRALHTVNDTTATFGNQANHALKFARLGLAFAIELGSDATPANLTAEAAAATLAAPAQKTATAAR